MSHVDVKRILDTIREAEEWAKRSIELDERLRHLPRSQRGALRAEREIVRQQLMHYMALIEDMKRSVTRPGVSDFIEFI